MGPTEFTARAEVSNGIARIAPGGELDLASVPILTEQLARFENDGVGAIMLDLRDLRFIDSTGLHAFLQASDHAKTNGHRLIPVGATPVAQRVFELTGTQFLLEDQDAVGVFDQFTGSGPRRAAQSRPRDVGAGA